MTPAQRELAPGCNPRPVEQSPSTESVVSNLPPTVHQRQDAPGPSTPQEREARALRARRRLREANDRRRVGRALNSMCADMGDRDPFGWFVPSEGWTRELGNEYVRRGFDVNYVARRLGLPAPATRQAVAA